MSGTPCPQCGFAVQQDFGVATCPNCQNVFMIHMDSQVSFDSVPQERQLNSATSPAVSGSFADSGLEDLSKTPPSEISSKDVLSDIQKFGNTEAPINPISYNLKISGLERQEIRKRLFEIFSEARLNFRSDALVNSIKDGHLMIKNLNPVKMSVLISRLRELPIQLSWTQGIYEVPPPEDLDLTKVPTRNPGAL